MATIQRYKDQLLKILSQYLPDAQIILFGSRARETAQEGADIDIALDNHTPIPLSLIAQIEDALEETTIPVFIDLIDIQTASDDLKKEIKKEGIIWKS